jgi:hypothetical protein
MVRSEDYEEDADIVSISKVTRINIKLQVEQHTKSVVLPQRHTETENTTPR